jgi:VWFA-related protein
VRTLIAFALAILAATQQQPPRLPSIGESIEVSIVNVDVFVTDKAGNRVRGLTQNDFEVYEDGKLRPITNFAEYSSEAPEAARVTVEGVAAPEAAVVAPPVEVAKRQKRTIAVFIDRIEMRPDKQREVFDRLRGTLRDLVEEGDRVSIITWERTRSLRVRQPYTGDIDLIDATLEKIGDDPTAGTTSDIEEIRRADEAEAVREEMLKARGASSGGGGGPSMEALMLCDRALGEMKSKTAALNALLSSMSGAEGQKVLLMMSHRFSMNVGHEFLTPKRTIGAPPDKYEMLYDTHKLVESVARTANANSVRIYSVYPAELPGVVVQSPEDNSMPQGTEAGVGGYEYSVLQNELSALQIVAERTGGAMTWHPAETVKLLDRLPDDFSSYYSLAYRATTSGADKAHSIRVKMKKPGLTARSRTEFVEKSADSKMGDRVVAQLFGLPTPASILHVIASAKGSARTSKKKMTIPIAVQVPIGALTTLPEGLEHRGAFSVYVVSSNGHGDLTDVTHQTQVYSIPTADLTRAKEGHFTYELNVIADDTTRRVAVGVLDEISKDFGLTQVDFGVKAP